MEARHRRYSMSFYHLPYSHKINLSTVQWKWTQNAPKLVSEHLKIKTFLRGHAPRPPKVGRASPTRLHCICQSHQPPYYKTSSYAPALHMCGDSSPGKLGWSMLFHITHSHSISTGFWGNFHCQLCKFRQAGLRHCHKVEHTYFSKFFFNLELCVFNPVHTHSLHFNSYGTAHVLGGGRRRSRGGGGGGGRMGRSRRACGGRGRRGLSGGARASWMVIVVCPI